jgi:hypothetical protein
MRSIAMRVSSALETRWAHHLISIHVEFQSVKGKGGGAGGGGRGAGGAWEACAVWITVCETQADPSRKIQGGRDGAFFVGRQYSQGHAIRRWKQFHVPLFVLRRESLIEYAGGYENDRGEARLRTRSWWCLCAREATPRASGPTGECTAATLGVSKRLRWRRRCTQAHPRKA